MIKNSCIIIQFFLDTRKRLPHIIRKARALFVGVVACCIHCKKGLTVKRYRGFCFFLLALSFLIPINVAYLYYDQYAEIELQTRKRFSNEDEESLLTLLKKNPPVLYSPGPSIQHHMISLLEVFFFQSNSFLPTDSKNPILRC